MTPSSLFLKRELRTRFDLLRPDLESEVARKQAQQKDHHDRRSASRKFSVGDLVMAKNFRAGPDWVPATIVARLGPLSYLVETQDKLVWRRHVDHVKLSHPCLNLPLHQSLSLSVSGNLLDQDPEVQ